MKKFLAFAAAGVLCLSAAGCGKGNETTENIVAETVKEAEKAVEEEAEEIEEEAEEITEEVQEAVEEEIPQIAPPAEIAALGYDSSYIINHKNKICMPYSSERYSFNNFVTEVIQNDENKIYAFVYDFSSNFEYGRQSVVDKAEENNAEIQEFTLGDFSVISSTTQPYFWTTEYYVDFNGKFGDGDDVQGAFISVSESKGNREATLSDEVKDMISNIFIAE